MSDLAFTQNGDCFDVPAAVTGWRVRRLKPRGAPELVYGRDGRPLVVPVECDMDDLRAAVGMLGKYRLDPVDDNGKVIEGVPAAYVQVVKAEKPADEPSVASPNAERDSVLKEALRANTELAKAVVDRFPEMMHAAAELLRAADGAGLPARVARLIERDDEDDDDGDEDEQINAPAGFDLNAMVAQLVPVLVTGLMSGKVKMPGLAALFDWRKAAPANDACESTDQPAKQKLPKKKKRVVEVTPADTAPKEAVEHDGTETEEAGEQAALPPLDPATMAHFIAIQSALSPEEGELAREVAAQLSPAEMRAWFDELSKLSVDEAVAKIRKIVSGAGKTGGAS